MKIKKVGFRADLLFLYGGGIMVDVSSFEVIQVKVETDSSKRVDYIDVIVEMTDYAGTVYFTDLMLQGGTVGTSWVGHVSEIRWSFDNA